MTLIDDDRTRPSLFVRLLFTFALAFAFSFTAAAQAQVPGPVADAPSDAAPAPGPVAAPAANPASLTELKAAAYDAQQKADAARAEAARVQQELAAAEQAAAAPPPAPAPAPVPVVLPVAAPPVQPASPASPPAADVTQAEFDELSVAVERARADAKAAQAEAEAARAAADQARAEFEAYREKQEHRFARKGVVLGANLFYALEIFDTGLSVDDGKGFGLSLGYRIHERFELSLESNRVVGFDFSGYGVTGDIDGWTATANARVFLLTKSFQPYLGMGLGAFYAEADARDAAGNRETHSQASGLFKMNAGFDYYISERLAVTADAALYLPGGELSMLNFATFGGGIKVRF